MPGLFAAGGLFGPDKSLQRMRIANKDKANRRQNSADVAIAAETGEQPGSTVAGDVSGAVGMLGTDAAQVLGSIYGKNAVPGASPATTSTGTGSVDPLILGAGLLAVLGIGYVVLK